MVLRKRSGELEFADSMIRESNQSKNAKAGTAVEKDLQIAVLSMLHQGGALPDNVYSKAAEKIKEGM